MKHFLLAILAGNVIFWGSLFYLNFYTRHGETIAIPDVKGMYLNEALKKLQESNMQGTISDSVFLNDFKKGAIVEQNPPDGFKVKNGRKVFLTINSFFPERIKMPNLVGISLRQAKAVLETYGLKTGKLRYVPDIAKDNVLEQKYKGKKISEGTPLEKGSYIDFILGKGGEAENDTTQSEKQIIEPDDEIL